MCSPHWKSVRSNYCCPFFPPDLHVTVELKNGECLFFSPINAVCGLDGRTWFLSIWQVKQDDDRSQRRPNIPQSCLNFSCSKFFISAVQRRPWKCCNITYYYFLELTSTQPFGPHFSFVTKSSYIFLHYKVPSSQFGPGSQIHYSTQFHSSNKNVTFTLLQSSL